MAGSLGMSQQSRARNATPVPRSERASFVPRRLLNIVTTKSGTPFRKVAQGHKANVSIVVYRSVLPSIVIGSEGGKVLRTAATLRKAYVVNFTKAKTPQKTPQVVVIKLW